MFERMLLSGIAGGKGKVKKLGLFNRPLLASDGGVDWYGEVSSEEFITGSALSTLTGMTHGRLINDDVGWLNLTIDNKEVLIAKKPIRSTITRNQLSSLNLIEGDRVIVVGGSSYKIRLLFGHSPTLPVRHSTVTGEDPYWAKDSEYNRIMYRLCGDASEDFVDDTLLPYEKLANYTTLELGFLGNAEGRQTMCQEYSSEGSVLLRGLKSISYGWWESFSDTNAYASVGWRPVLERI